MFTSLRILNVNHVCFVIFHYHCLIAFDHLLQGTCGWAGFPSALVRRVRTAGLGPGAMTHTGPQNNVPQPAP